MNLGQVEGGVTVAGELVERRPLPVGRGRKFAVSAVGLGLVEKGLGVWHPEGGEGSCHQRPDEGHNHRRHHAPAECSVERLRP